MKKYRLEIGEPILVHQGRENETEWGYYQFPHIFYTKSGDVGVRWNERPDDRVKYQRKDFGEAISEDGGLTWRPKRDTDFEIKDCKMNNGCYFMGFVKQGAFEADYIADHTPACPIGKEGGQLHFAEDITEFKEQFEAMEYDPVTDERRIFPVQLNWRHRPLVELKPGKHILPLSYSLWVGNDTGTIRLNGDMYYAAYTHGFDSARESREEAVFPYCHYMSVYILRSRDNGRTWEYVSQVSVNDEVVQFSTRGLEGFCEPMMEQMPDGSVVMLMRSGGRFGHSLPCYLTRSTDGCKTWSKPIPFGRVGVLPHIMTLGCGVTLSVYGRPDLFLRATGDPAGLEWDDPVEIPLCDGEGHKSCYYTRMVPIDDTTVLMVYTDFHYPQRNGDGIGKAVLVRKIKVILED